MLALLLGAGAFVFPAAAPAAEDGGAAKSAMAPKGTGEGPAKAGTPATPVDPGAVGKDSSRKASGAPALPPRLAAPAEDDTSEKAADGDGSAPEASRAETQPSQGGTARSEAAGAGASGEGAPAGPAGKPALERDAALPSAAPAPANIARAGESVDQAICRLIDGAAKAQGLPASFLTRLIWRESSFRLNVVSNKGAQGIAQFMPATARERGLVNPFDPEAAIPASARLLADHLQQFGNLGLAAAAYNAGPGRVSGFLAGGGLPMETRNYVLFITGRQAEDWAALRTKGGTAPAFPADDCAKTVVSLRKGGGPGPKLDGPGEIFAPWGVQISGNYSREIALASYQREAQRFRGVMGNARPMIVSTKVGGRGAKVFYRVRVPAQTREAAMAICDKLRKAGGACIVAPN